MKKAGVSLIILFIFFLLSACNSNNDTDAVKNGTYTLEQTELETAFSPKVTITDEDILFSYDLLSSYLPIGTYTIDNEKLTMTTYDDLYHYVFRIDGDNLIFLKNKSSSVSLIDSRFGVKIADGAIFKLESISDIKTIANNDIFTEEAYEQLQEIDYWNGDTKLVIDKEADMRSFYDNLSSLELTEPGLFAGDKAGHLIIDLVMKDETMSIGLLSGEIIINGKKYVTDKNICDAVRTIALNYEDYYNNDVFTEDLFEQLIEIDCWVDDERLVINDADRLEEVYHYLSRLTLEEASPEYKLISEPLRIDLVTESSKISFGITSKVLCTTEKLYYTDSTRDLVQLITQVAQEKE